MAVKFKDYYETLGVDRKAAQDDIRSAYRKLARKFHPDVNKDDKNAQKKFAEINEAYEVLGDAEKRKKYDALGANWKQGQEFRPPPGWENMQYEFRTGPRGAGGAEGFNFGSGGFSDFFEMFFGRGGAGGGRGFQSHFDDMVAGKAYEGAHRGNGRRHDAEITISLEDAYHGVTKGIDMQWNEPGPNGILQPVNRHFDVKIPAGTTDGTVIRLAGGTGGDGDGDIHLKIHIAEHPRYEVTGHDLTTELRITPWEAALGAKVPVHTLDQDTVVTVPPGSASGQKLRLKGKGLPRKRGERGDLFARIKIVVPKTLTDEERKLFEMLQEVSKFDPR